MSSVCYISGMNCKSQEVLDFIPSNSFVGGGLFQIVKADFANFKGLYQKINDFHDKYKDEIKEIIKNKIPIFEDLYAMLVSYTNVFYINYKDACKLDNGKSYISNLSYQLKNEKFWCFEHAICAKGFLQYKNIDSFFIGGNIYQGKLNAENTGNHAFILIKDKLNNANFIYDPFHSMQLSINRNMKVALPALYYINASENSINKFIKTPSKTCKVFKVIDTTDNLKRWYGYTRTLPIKIFNKRLKINERFTNYLILNESEISKLPKEEIDNLFKQSEARMDSVDSWVPVDKTNGNGINKIPKEVKEKLISFLENVK